MTSNADAKTFLPQTTFWKSVAVALGLAILCAGAVVVSKYARNVFTGAQMAWASRTDRFTGAAVNRSEVAKYGDRVPHEKARKGLSAKKTVRVTTATMANPSNAVKVTGAATTGIGYGFTLSAENLDELLSNAPGAGDATATVSACGGTCSIAISKYATGGMSPLHTPPDGWSGDELTAWYVWCDLLPHDAMGYAVALFDGSVNAGGVGGSTAHQYLCVGVWDSMGPSTYCGPTHWDLAGTLSISNLQMRLEVHDHTSSRLTLPRRWSDRDGYYSLYTMTDPVTCTVATLGDKSVTAPVAMGEDENGKVPENCTMLTWFSGALGTIIPATLNRDYALISDVKTLQGAVPINLNCSFWSTHDDGTDWTASWDAPTGAVWHCFNSGNSLHLQAVGGSPTAAGIDTTTTIAGPVRWNVKAARFGYDAAFGLIGFPLPGTFLVDVGLCQYISETVTNPILLGLGTSAWYVGSATGLSTNLGIALHTGGYTWGVGGGDTDTAPVVQEDWLTTNNELLTAGGGETLAVDNRKASVALASVQSDPATETPAWASPIHYEWTETSVDKPPGHDTRPSAWTAGTGMTIAPDDWWTSAEGGGTLLRTLATRHDARMNYLASGWGGGTVDYDPDWPIIAIANHRLDFDPAVVAAVCALEDVTNYDNSRVLALSVAFDETHPRPEVLDWTAAKLKLTYRTWTFDDPCYTPENLDGTNRFGAAGDFTADSSDATVTFPGYATDPLIDPTGNTCCFDLGTLRRPKGVDLRHVVSLELTLPGGLTCQFVDLRLVLDPHGAHVSEPRWVPQPAVDPWDYLACACGYASTNNGVPNLNIPNGTEGQFAGDAQWGIKQTQYLAPNPALETPPEVDPTFARTLVRWASIIGLQEQLTATVLDSAAIAAATTDDEGNSLGEPYFWDLDRPTGDDVDHGCAIRVVQIKSFGAGCPLIPTTMNVRWCSQGRAQGIVMDDSGTVIRNDVAGCSDDPGAYPWQLLRSIDGAPWELLGSAQPDSTGRLVLPPAVEREGYVYGLRQNGRADSTIGPFVTRQYADLIAMQVGAKSRPAAWVEPVTGICHVAFVEGSDVRYCQSDPWTSAGFRGWRYGGLVPTKGSSQTIAAFTGGYTDPAVVVLPTREVIVSARSTTAPYAVTIKRSLNQGATWEALVGNFVTDLTQLALWQSKGIIHGAGIKNGNAVYRRSCDGGKTAAPVGSGLGGGGTVEATICAAADEQPAIVIDPTGAGYALVNTGSVLACMVTKDGGNSWVQSDTI